MLFNQVVQLLEQKINNLPEPMTREIVDRFGTDPYLILVSCLLSLRTRDTVTLPVSLRLFERVRTPQKMTEFSISEIETIIKPVNYYRRKAQQLIDVSRELMDRFGGKVPNSLIELYSIKGIGLKTANLVLAEAFGVPAICVDTHVHRLSQKEHFGLIDTKTPDQTEKKLRSVLPERYWIAWNYLLVKWGQNICKTAACKSEACAEIKNIIQKG